MVYEYAIVDKSGKHSLADLRSLQDGICAMHWRLCPVLPKCQYWRLRPAVSGTARSYKLLALWHPAFYRHR